MAYLHDVPRPGHCETVLIQQWCPSGIVQRDGFMLPVIRDDVDEAIGGIHQLPSIDRVHHFLRSSARQHALRLGDDGHLEAGQFPFDASPSLLDRPLHRVAVLPHDFFRRILEGFKAGDEDVGDEKKPARGGVVFISPSEDFFGYHFAEQCSREVDGLVMGGEGLFSDELGSVDEETIDWR